MRPTSGFWATPWSATGRSSPVRTRLRLPGRWSTQSLSPITGFAFISAAAGGRKRLTRSSLQTALGTTPDPRRHPNQLRHAGERSDCGAAFERRRRLDPRDGRTEGFIGSSIKSCCKTEVAAPVTACRGRTSDLPAPPTIAEPAKQKQNNQDDDDEGRR